MAYGVFRDILSPLLGGVGLLLFGIKNLSSGARDAAGERLRKVLHYLTRNPIMGVFSGMAVTALLHSSSTVTVMVVGFVNAGLMTLRQAIGVIYGANIGTTLNAWIVASMTWLQNYGGISTYAFPLIAIGTVTVFIAGTTKSRGYGYTILGLGLLFLGLNTMEVALKPLKDNELMKTIFVKFSDYPILGVLAGTVFTCVLQSSSMTIAFVQVLAVSGLLSLDAAIPIVLGDNIGTTITAQLAALGSNTNARRSAMAHTMFNAIGTAYMMIFVYTGIYSSVIRAALGGTITPNNIGFAIAISHSSFNIINTIVFLPLVGWLERLVVAMIPSKANELDMKPKYLDLNLLDTPPMALEQTTREIIRMTGIAKDAFDCAIKGFLTDDRKMLASVAPKEEAVDNLQTEITRYLIGLSQKHLDEEEAQKLPVLLHTVNDVERIGDHAENLVEITEKKLEQKLGMSEAANKEITRMSEEADMMVEDVINALSQNDHRIARRALKREEAINRMHLEFKQNHIDRLNKGECGLLPGLIYIDMLANIEKVGDHLTNIAQAVLGNLLWNHSDEPEEPIVSKMPKQISPA
jgi:phosphate:Na+ symporter